MIRAAIVEDDAAAAELIEGYLERYGGENGVAFRSEKFSRIAALLADILIPNLMKEEYFV